MREKTKRKNLYCIDKRFGTVSSTEYSFKAKVTSCGFHLFKETTRNNVKEGDSVRVDLETNKLSKNVDPYARVMRGIYPERKFSSCLLFYQDKRWFCKWFSYIN